MLGLLCGRCGVLFRELERAHAGKEHARFCPSCRMKEGRFTRKEPRVEVVQPRAWRLRCLRCGAEREVGRNPRGGFVCRTDARHPVQAEPLG